MLPDDEARLAAMSRYRAAGFTPDAFAHRRPARSAALEALIEAEDWYERVHPRRDQERLALRGVRRRLEVELWP